VSEKRQKGYRNTPAGIERFPFAEYPRRPDRLFFNGPQKQAT
jgi:hypothetical protein